MNIYQKLRILNNEIHISDIGLDLTFSNSLLSQSNMSFIVTKISCDNMNEISDKKVSIDNVMRRINMMSGSSYNNIINIAISGANYSPNKKSHAWIGFSKKMSTYRLEAFYHIGFPYEPNTMDRKRVNEYFSSIFLKLLEAFIDNTKLSTKEMKSLGIDAFFDERYSLEELIDFVKEKRFGIIEQKNKTFFVQRTEDVLRETEYIYRGSFNPPTLFHCDVIKFNNPLVELTTNHFEKDINTLIPINHRISMLLEFTDRILISNCAKFSDLDKKIEEFIHEDYKSINYLIGKDVIDKIDKDDPVLNRIKDLNLFNYSKSYCRATNYRNTNDSNLVPGYVHFYMNKILGYFNDKFDKNYINNIDI